MSITVSVSGLKELDQALGELPKATARNVLKRTLNKAAVPMVEEAKRQVLTALGRSLTEPHPPRGLEEPTGALASF